MAVMMTLGVFEPEPPPDIPRGIRVSYQTASADGDMPERRETGGTMTEPIRAQDGLVYVGVSVYGRGVVMLPVNSLPITRSVPDTRVHSLAGATKSRPSPSPRCSPGRASTTLLAHFLDKYGVRRQLSLFGGETAWTRVRRHVRIAISLLGEHERPGSAWGPAFPLCW